MSSPTALSLPGDMLYGSLTAGPLGDSLEAKLFSGGDCIDQEPITWCMDRQMPNNRISEGNTEIKVGRQ